MKEGWEIKKLGEVANVRSGKSIEASNISNTPSPYPCYGGNGIRGYVDCYNYDGHFPIIGRVGALCGNVHLAKGKFYATEHALVVEIKDVNINAEWLSFSLEFLKLRSIAKGVAQPVIAANEVAKLPIPIPPLPEQERIVSELDCINGILEKKREQLKELDALAQSIFYDMFGDPIQNEKGWEVRKIKDISVVKIGPFGSLLHTSDYVSGGTPLVNPVHMQEEMIFPDENFTVSKDKLNELQNYVLHSGDIIFARRGDIGRCAVVSEKADGYLCGTGSLFVRMTTCINQTYFIKMMRSNSMIKQLNSLAKGATMLNINCKIIEDLSIPLPPLSLQQSFASKIEAIEKQKELIKRSIAETETLLASRMQYYFG